MASMILIRYGEFTLKGNNRSRFEEAVIRDIRRQLRDFPEIKLETDYGRLFVVLNGARFEEAAEKLKTVFGISSFSPVQRCGLELEEIRNIALQVMQSRASAPGTFKVTVRRPNKKFPMETMELLRHIGGYVLSQMPELKVDVHHPEVELVVEIREQHAYVFCESIQGLGGYPVGTNGKAALLLSGGIDSPVAGFLALKSGLSVEAVHFHSYPFTSERAQQKVKELAERLAVYAGGEMTLHMVPFTDIQTRLKEQGNEKLLVTLIRRAMMRVASRLAERNEAKAIVTGESLGQVASQTLPSLTVIGQAAALPVLQPLIMMDKSEIIRIAERIDTYKISIQPYEDCCTLFVPKSPSTNPNPNVIAQIEENTEGLEALVEQAIARTDTLRVGTHKQQEHTNYF